VPVGAGESVTTSSYHVAADAARPSRLPSAEDLPLRDGAVALLDDRLLDGPVGVLLVEPVGLDAVADGHGGEAADAGRAAVVRHLRRSVGAALLGRLDGDRYLIVTDQRSGEVSDATWTRAEELAGEVRFELPSGSDILPVLRLAVGGAVPVPGEGSTDALAAARKALTRSLVAGEPVVVNDPWAGNDARRRLRLANDLADHLDRDDVSMAYQPIVDLASGRQVKVEALLRWRHPVLGPVVPDEVLAAAHLAGATRAFTLELARRVAVDLAWYRRTTGEALPVAFNLSAEQLAVVDPDELLEAFSPGVEPGDLTIEVTETAVPVDVTEAVATLTVFRRAGASVAVDDFGAGFASLGYLRRLPADIVKIDREFVDELGTWTTDGSFAEVIRSMVGRLGLVTVAEGVETVAQLEAVSAMGCEYGQGWLFGRPMRVEDLVPRADATGRAAG
jgi:EAL domain-containing protein (putative c-di-GMP-specific phosphodiesterase class I)